MRDSLVADTAPDDDACRKELHAILASSGFRNAPALSKILSYICNKHLSGEDASINEWSIALEALGRKSHFDPERDSIVRVEVHLLRKRLLDFYLKEGASHSIHIRLAKVGYVPKFEAVTPVTDGRPKDGSAADIFFDYGTTPVSAKGETARLTWSILFSLGTFLAVSLTVFNWQRVQASASHAQDLTHFSLLAANLFPEEIRIAAGLLVPRSIDSSGRSWMGDRYFSGGTVFERPDRLIAGTLDQSIYLRGREGEFRYDIPLKPGSYELRLHFAETEFGQTLSEGAEAQRRFVVQVNGRTVLDRFDIADDAGGSNIATVKILNGVTPAEDGLLHLEFAAFAGLPLLNAIEIIPSVPGQPKPVRIVCSPQAAFDKSGRLWQSDGYFLGGRHSARRASLNGDDDPSLYSSSRFGNFAYAIPVAPNHRYRLTFHFAELYFKRAGERVFNVFCNGQSLLSNFDILDKAGAPDKMLALSFAHLSPNAQGKLIVNFVPIRDYAVVRALEVLPE